VSTGALSQFGSLTDHLVTRRAPILLTDTRAQSEFVRSDELLLVHSYLGIPLIAGGELVGYVWKLDRQAAGLLVSTTLNLLSFISGQAAVAIRNAKII
jgi:GAF domain-containing protein